MFSLFVLPLVQCDCINAEIPSAGSLRTIRVFFKDDRHVLISDFPFPFQQQRNQNYKLNTQCSSDPSSLSIVYAQKLPKSTSWMFCCSDVISKIREKREKRFLAMVQAQRMNLGLFCGFYRTGRRSVPQRPGTRTRLVHCRVTVQGTAVPLSNRSVFFII